jgi:hypothetical protein
MAPSTPVRRPLKAKSGGRGSTRAGAIAGGKPRGRQRAAGSDVEALHGKLGDALSLLGSMLD